MLNVPSAQGPPAPRSTRVVPQIMALEPHSSEHGASSRKIVPRCSITRHRLKQHCAGKPGFIRRMRSTHPGSFGTPLSQAPAQLDGEVSSQQLPETGPAAAHMHTHPAVGFSPITAIQGKGTGQRWRYGGIPQRGGAAKLFFICSAREITKEINLLQDR